MNTQNQNNASDNNGIKEENLDLRIRNEVLKIKIELSEKRFNTMMGIGGLFVALAGIVFPIMLALNSSTNVKDSIDWMRKEVETMKSENYQQQTKQNAEITASKNNFENKIETLIVKQIKYPKLELFYNGRTLDGSVINMSPSNENAKITVHNSGSGVASDIRFKLYSGNDHIGLIFEENEDRGSYKYPSDLNNYGRMSEYNLYNVIPNIIPGENRAFYFHMWPYENDTVKTRTDDVEIQLLCAGQEIVKYSIKVIYKR